MNLPSFSLKSGGQIHIGTSGWSYKDWKGLFYPDGLAEPGWLTYYSGIFSTTEINSSFYHLPRKETVENWTKKVPEKFWFCPKMSRYITHMKKLQEVSEPLDLFLEVFRPMKEKMGPVLVQLPPSLNFDPLRTKAFFKLLKTHRGYRFALEARHASWFEPDAVSMMEDQGISLVISQSGQRYPYSELTTAKDVYVRFHGPDKLYSSLYDLPTLEKYAHLFKGWEKEGRQVWAFFNNDFFGYAIRNARELEGMMGKPKGRGKK